MTIHVPSSVSIESFQRLRIETYTNVAAAALLAHDYFLTLNAEVSLIWPSRFNFVKVLFLLTRYMPFVDVSLVLYYQLREDISAETCRQVYTPTGWLVLLGIIVAEVILIVRTWAIWGRGKRLAIGLASIGLAAAAPALAIEYIFLKSLVFAPYPSRGTPGCLLSDGGPIIAVSFVILIIFETFMLILTLIKGVQHYRIRGNRGFVSVLYRDGILFYVYLLAISLTNLIVIVAAPRDLADMLATVQRVLHSSLSARVLMNLREAGKREELDLSLNSTPLRNLNFAHTAEIHELPPLSAGTLESFSSGCILPLGTNAIMDVSTVTGTTHIP